MDYNKILLGGKMTKKPEMVTVGTMSAVRLELEYTNYKKVAQKFSVLVTNEKTIAFLLKPYMREGTELFIEGMLTAPEGKPMSIFAQSVNVCKFAPPEKKEQGNPNDTEITKDDFDSDEIPW